MTNTQTETLLPPPLPPVSPRVMLEAITALLTATCANLQGQRFAQAVEQLESANALLEKLLELGQHGAEAQRAADLVAAVAGAGFELSYAQGVVL